MNISIKKGESLGFLYNATFNGKPIDLTDDTLLLQVRETPVDTGVYLIEKKISQTSIIDEVGQIIDPVNGQFIFQINASDIEDLSTLRPYFLAIFLNQGNQSLCISSQSCCDLAIFKVCNP